jgi:hypothetical protein
MAFLGIAILSVATSLQSYAQSAASPDSNAQASARKWHFLLEPYLMLPNINGTVGSGTLPEAGIDENPGDIFNHLQIGAMAYAEVYSDRWVISSDLTYMKLGQDIVPSKVISSGHADLKQLAWELAVMKRLKPWLSLGLAGQLNSMTTDLDITGLATGVPVTSNRSFTKTWVDPSIVAAVKLPLSRKFTLRTRGNIGGFGIGSKIFWQLQVYADYHIGRLCQVSAGYRVIKVDYEKGSGDDYFLYNVTTFGPVLRFGFNL